ncbi:MAG: SH3 domain-containing protein [Rhizobiales bacterium]|nr:SH3 domain-containing protein [Hyphomicrobiales bacterium]
MLRYVLIVLSALALAPSLAAAGEQPARSRIQFAPGTNAAMVKGRVVGYQVRDYVVGARAGQTMTVTLSTNNRSATFNVMPPFGDEAVFIGSVSGTRFSGRLDRGGDYVISVGLMRNAARRGERADYSLAVRIKGGAPIAVLPPPKNDFADGLMGGPDEWRVVGVPAGDLLNIRTKPAANAPRVASVPNGTRLANRSCRLVESSRWCLVEIPGGSGISGWANGRYLRE